MLDWHYIVARWFGTLQSVGEFILIANGSEELMFTGKCCRQPLNDLLTHSVDDHLNGLSKHFFTEITFLEKSRKV